jgi:hypothetical protein
LHARLLSGVLASFAFVRSSLFKISHSCFDLPFVQLKLSVMLVWEDAFLISFDELLAIFEISC